MLVIDPFDGIAFRRNQDETFDVRSQKARALLAYLSFKTDFCDSRERIVGLLWSESDEVKARAALRQCLRKIKQSLGPKSDDFLTTNRSSVGLNASTVTSLALEIERRLNTGQVDEFLLKTACHPSKLLHGFDDIDPSFTAWLHILRQSWTNKVSSRLEELAFGNRKQRVQVKAAQALINLDESHEPAHRFLMKGHVAEGNSSAAIRMYERLRDILHDQFDTDPEPETINLIAKIKAGTFNADRQTDVLVGNSAISTQTLECAAVIAVDTVRTSAKLSKNNYVIEGFRRELISSLSRFREFIILERGENEKTANADFVVETDMFQTNEGARFITSLKEINNSRILWSETYDAATVDLSSAIRRIVRRISLALNIHISADRISKINYELGDWSVIDQWLYGQSLSFIWSAEERNEAEAIFESIVKKSPNFAPAYSSLVMLRNTRHLAFPGLMRSSDREREALSLARTAVSLDPLDTKTHLAAAWSMLMNAQYSSAQQFFAQSYDLNPNDPWTIVSSALGLAFGGALEEGLELAQQALQLDQAPSPSHCEYQANINFLAQRYEESSKWGQLAGGVTVDSLGWRVASLAHLGRTENAKELASEFIRFASAKWHGLREPSSEVVVEWFLHCFPLANEDARERLRVGLAMARVCEI